MRYIKELTERQKKALQGVMKEDNIFRARQRAHAIILSSKKYSIDRLSEIFEVDRDTISRWFDWWEKGGLKLLYDKPKPGRKKILTSKEEKQAIQIVEKNPKDLKLALVEIKEKIKKEISKDTLKRCLKESNYRWKRIKKSVKKREIHKNSKK